jgi:hypothetical protein
MAATALMGFVMMPSAEKDNEADCPDHVNIITAFYPIAG